MEKGNYHTNYRLQISTGRNGCNLMPWQGEGPRRDTRAPARHALKELTNGTTKVKNDHRS